MDCLWIGKTAQIVIKGVIGDGIPVFSPMPHFSFQKKFWIMANQCFREGRWLDQKKPMVIACGKILVGGVIHHKGGRDIKHRQLANGVGIIAGQTMRHATAAIMPGDKKLLMP